MGQAARQHSFSTTATNEGVQQRSHSTEKWKQMRDSSRKLFLPCATSVSKVPAMLGQVLPPNSKSTMTPDLFSRSHQESFATREETNPPACTEDEGTTTCSDVEDRLSFGESLGSESHSVDTDKAFPCSAPDLKVAGSKTTLMIRNVPVMYTEEMLLAEWPNVDTYDFLYLPKSSSLQRNLSYAFINFTTESAAAAFQQLWQKRRLAHFSSRKPLNISIADVQGRDENLRRLKMNSSGRTKTRCHPLIFEQGKRVQLDLSADGLEELAKDVWPHDQVVAQDDPVLMLHDPLAEPYVLQRFSL